MTTQQSKLKQNIKRLIVLFIAGLVFSGLTAFPIELELSVANNLLRHINNDEKIVEWIRHVHAGVQETNIKYPFIAYGTDWLAFAHLIIAIAFIGPLRDPIKNIWVIEFGIIACLCIFPLAFIAGSIRGILIYWQLIDCSFGIVGGVLLLNCLCKIKKLAALQKGIV